MSKVKILTIDDDEAVRTSFYVFLSDFGYQALTAKNGLEGIQIFEDEQPDVVLIDLRMPGMNGFEVITHLKEKSPETPLIVVSGIGEIDDAINTIRLGAWDYLTKPVQDLSTLTHVIEKALEHSRLIRENRVYRDELEKKVELRTRELAEASHHLSEINKQLRQIITISRNLSACDTVENLSQRALNEFAHLMKVTGGSLYLVGEKALKLAYALDSGHAPMEIPFPLPEHSVFDVVMKKKTPYLIDDITALSELKSSGWKKYRSKSALIFPLVDESNFVIALLSLHNKATQRFTRQEKEIGAILASFCCESLRAVRAAEEISRSERRLNLAIHGANLGTWDWHIPSGNVMFNEHWGRITGYHIEDMEQNRKAWEELIHPDDISAVQKALEDHLSGVTHTYECNYRIKHKSGHLVRVLDKGKLIERDSSGNPLRLCGTYLEIISKP